MDTKIKFLYLSEPDMIKAGVKNMDQCVEAMEDLLLTLNKGDYVRECQRMQMTDALWLCRHILAASTRWQV